MGAWLVVWSVLFMLATLLTNLGFFPNAANRVLTTSVRIDPVEVGAAHFPTARAAESSLSFASATPMPHDHARVGVLRSHRLHVPIDVARGVISAVAKPMRRDESQSISSSTSCSPSRFASKSKSRPRSTAMPQPKSSFTPDRRTPDHR